MFKFLFITEYFLSVFLKFKGYSSYLTNSHFMNLLILNCGSSSIKFQLFEMPGEKMLLQGKAEKNEEGGTDFQLKTNKRNLKNSRSGFSFSENFEIILKELVHPENECLSSYGELDAIGHRLIHGGEKGKECVEITDEMFSYMESQIMLAPLHYPANLEGIRRMRELLPSILQGGVFDTAFHHTLPPKAFLYGIPLEWCGKHSIRRYGFHGISHKYASQRVYTLTGLSPKKCKVITCHLGNGSSLAAIKDGISVDTSMGMTPVEGLLMGTRCGDIDAGVLIYLQEKFHLSATDIQQLLNKEGGLLGLSGISSDYRAVEEAAAKGDKVAQTAMDVYHYRIKKYIGAYAAALEGIDALVFTGGIGENSVSARKEICNGLDFLGIHLSQEFNRNENGKEAVISEKSSKTRVVIVPANEELMIAREVAALISGLRI
jgi:acetate kinase